MVMYVATPPLSLCFASLVTALRGGLTLLRSVRTRLLILVRLILIYGSHDYSLFILLLVTFECGYYDSNRSWAVT